MERIKVVALAVIAAALAVLAGQALMPVAHGQSADVQCEVLVLPAYERNATEKLVDDAAPAVTILQDFFRRHPSAVPIYRADFPSVYANAVTGYATIICMR